MNFEMFAFISFLQSMVEDIISIMVEAFENDKDTVDWGDSLQASSYGRLERFLEEQCAYEINDIIKFMNELFTNRVRHIFWLLH